MTTTLGILSDAQVGIDAVLALPLPALTAWKITKLAQEIMPHVVNFGEQRAKAAQRHGTPIPERDGYVSFEGEAKTRYEDELSALRAEPIELKSALISLKSLAAFNVSGAHLIALGPLLIDDTEG